MNHSLITKDLGCISAYGDALSGGYTGTKEQLMSLVASVLGGAVLVSIGKTQIFLLSTAWNSSGVADLSNAFPVNQYSILYIDLDFDNALGTQIAAWYDADIYFTSDNKLVAHEDTPSIDLPIIVIYQTSRE